VVRNHAARNATVEHLAVVKGARDIAFASQNQAIGFAQEGFVVRNGPQFRKVCNSSRISSLLLRWRRCPCVAWQALGNSPGKYVSGEFHGTQLWKDPVPSRRHHPDS